MRFNILLAIVLSLNLSSAAIAADSRAVGDSVRCDRRDCNNPEDCKRADQEQNRCKEAVRKVNKFEADRRQEEYNRQHQAEIDTAKRLQDLNKINKSVGVEPPVPQPYVRKPE
jgi:hypothetical protein